MKTVQLGLEVHHCYLKLTFFEISFTFLNKILEINFPEDIVMSSYLIPQSQTSLGGEISGLS